MGYSSNTHFSPLTDKVNLYTDGCGNSYEDKYYVNGTYIDLCGLPVEEYMKNPFCCGNNSGSSDEPVKPVNQIAVKTFDDENGVIYYQAFAQFAVASNIKVHVSSTTEVVTELDLYAGNTASQPEIGETYDFLVATISIEEDETYRYVMASEETKITYNIYTKAVLSSEVQDFTDDFTKTVMEVGTTSDISFKINGTDFNYNDVTDITEFNEFCLANVHSFVLYIPKDVYDKKVYTISNYGGSDITGKFVFKHEKDIDNMKYVALAEEATTDIMPFVPLYKEDIIYDYKLTLNKS